MVVVETANLRWQASGEPVSDLFGDVYFSASDGLAETRHVFLENNDLSSRLRRVRETQVFTIAETGFGTGLNFLAASKLWTETGGCGWLHFVSFERFPLRYPDLEKALARWPELAREAESLLTQYPEPIAGVHRLVWSEARIRLTLCFSDALDGLRQLPFHADAWFLDGFAPRCNPDLWQQPLFEEIARHSGPGATLATFTAAGAVRRGLEGAGFEVRKVPGFGRKREMLRACRKSPESPPTLRNAPLNTVIVVGAGLAGCLVAANLAQRGKRVTLIEAGDSVGSGASGNRQGALYVKLGVDYNAQSQLALASLLFAQRFYTQLQAHTACPFWHQTGLLQMATTEAEADRQRRFLARETYPATILGPVTPEQASALSGLTLRHPGLYFPASGWLSPRRLCETLAAQPGIELLTATVVAAYGQDDRGTWIETADRTRLHCDQLVLCTGASELLKSLDLPIKPIRGQVSWWPDGALPAPACVICGEGYINPSDGEAVTLGATFDLKSQDPTVRPQDHACNLSAVGQWLPAVDAVDAETAVPLASGRTAFRCTTPDYQPLAGGLLPEIQWEEGKLPASMAELMTRSASHPGIAVLAGLGSKGLAYAPLLAEWLCDQICQEAPALPAPLAERVHPQRFAVRRALKSAGTSPT